MTEADMAACLALMGENRVVATGEGSVYDSEQSARDACELHDKDLVHIGAGWLAKSRTTTSGPMPTLEGDIIVHHLGQHFLVWDVTEDGAQRYGDNVTPFDSRWRTAAEEEARLRRDRTGGKVYWLQGNEDESKEVWSQVEL